MDLKYQIRVSRFVKKAGNSALSLWYEKDRDKIWQIELEYVFARNRAKNGALRQKFEKLKKERDAP